MTTAAYLGTTIVKLVLAGLFGYGWFRLAEWVAIKTVEMEEKAERRRQYKIILRAYKAREEEKRARRIWDQVEEEELNEQLGYSQNPEAA